MAKIKVMCVDDSAVVRQTLSEILNSDPDIEVVAVAVDPFQAAQKMRDVIPDVITLDVEMPKMDGVTFLRRLMSQHPIPVVMCSSLTEEGCETTFKALEYGAVDIICKPRLDTKRFLEEARIRIIDAVKGAAQVKSTKLKRKPAQTKRLGVEPKLNPDAMLAAPGTRAMARTTEKIVVVGASTGGTEALKVFLSAIPSNCPGIVIVQHMPEKFTAAFAKRLNSECAVSVKEAADNDTVLPGHVLIAPGNKHTLLKRSGARYYVEVRDGPLISRHRPSVDVLFRAAARYGGKNIVGVIMTGMGDDGAIGMLEMKQAGALNYAQDERTCVVFGMPNEAIKKGAVDKVLPLESLASAVINSCRD
jgi:two-component system chemotaxis response regulator CheB